MSDDKNKKITLEQLKKKQKVGDWIVTVRKKGDKEPEKNSHQVQMPIVGGVMDCFVCGKPCGYPVCDECTKEGYDINKILSGEQKPKIKELICDEEQKDTGSQSKLF